MNEKEINRLLADLDPGIVLVYQGPAAGCPHCREAVTATIAEAA